MPLIGTFGAGSAKAFGFTSGGFAGMCASGGTTTEDGAYKVHTFTGSGSFCVSALSPDPAANVVEYLLVAGGGNGGSAPNLPCTGGGGAGGFRESPGATAGCYSVSPLGVSPAAAIPVSCSPGAYPVTVGAGGNDTIFACLTSRRGGAGGPQPMGSGGPGGSGGGGGGSNGNGAIGIGNTPPVTPPQGNNGGTNDFGGGGGGAAGTGSHAGGAGYAPEIAGTPAVFRSGGGGNGHNDQSSQPQCATSGKVSNATSGAANTGSGGGAANPSSPPYGPPNKGGPGSGGSGIVILRYRIK